MSNSVLHKADTRGKANHGWLQANHTFSFANYHDPSRMHFGALRVLNDDTVAAGMGFGMHPHDNMEIITLPLEGALEHRDSMGNVGVIRHNDLQVMSAGTGVRHSEYNKNKDAAVKLLQIWLLPNARNVTPRYDQIELDPADRHNKWQQIVSPNPTDAGTWIHQNAWFQLATLESGVALPYALHGATQGVYVFVISGKITVEGQTLDARDGLGLWDVAAITVQADSAAEVLLMEVPM